MSVTDFASKYMQFFKDADLDNSGFLTLDEVAKCLKDKGYRGTDAQIKAIFEKEDTSGDKKLSLEEFLIAMGAMPLEAHKAAMMMRYFKSYDKNGDGKIDRKELSAVYAELKKDFSAEDLDLFMATADKGKDGTINYEEFVTLFFTN